MFRSFARYGFLALLLFLPGCQDSRKTSSAPDTFIILIDRSASIAPAEQADYANYLTTAVIPSITPGSLVTVETIVGSNTHSNPIHKEVQTLPPVIVLVNDLSSQIFTRDRGVDRKCLAVAKDQIPPFVEKRSEIEAKTIQRLRSKGDISSDTYLIDGMREASELLERKPGRGIIYILSDGLEDSDEFGPATKFDSIPFWGKRRPEALARQLNVSVAFPGLVGAHIYFYGLKSANNRIYSNVRSFWTAFFREAKAGSAIVGHGGPNFAEPVYNPMAKEICK